jgi:hypothetical protein
MHAMGAATATCAAPQSGVTHDPWGAMARLPNVQQVFWHAFCALSLCKQDGPTVLW